MRFQLVEARWNRPVVRLIGTIEFFYIMAVIQGNRLLYLTTSTVDRLGDQGLSGWGLGLLILPWEVQTHRCLSHYRT